VLEDDDGVVGISFERLIASTFSYKKMLEQNFATIKSRIILLQLVGSMPTSLHGWNEQRKDVSLESI